MGRFSRSEVESAFAEFYKVGCVDEDWTTWARMFTEECDYVEHFWGRMTKRSEVELWINAVMAGVPEIYTVLYWYVIDDEMVVWKLQNRRDNPDPDGPPYFDFPGLSVARYAGDGLWSYEEDYWAVNGARETAQLYAQACEKMGTSREERLTRRYWPAGPAFARTDAAPHPCWLDLPDVQPITKPRELRELLAELRGGA
ncbi:MAG: nuclear transport factor 2 family protein [Deltaproteobacteria bacterium]|jgi:hypothetical protein|nr:nuclear transport factor 2 family protein [Deltaproteobacteria bacterium]